MYTELRERQITNSRDHFKNFIAAFRQYDGISVLDWRNRDGSSEYYVRYVFDEDKNRLYISGDLGDAVVGLTEKATLESLSGYINMVDYFVGKIRCSTDKYYYDPELAESELKDRLLDDAGLTEEEIYDRETLIKELLEILDLNGGWKFEGCDVTLEELREIDEDYVKWIYGTGKTVAWRVILWLVGLNMAYGQVKDSMHPADRGEGEKAGITKADALAAYNTIMEYCRAQASCENCLFAMEEAAEYECLFDAPAPDRWQQLELDSMEGAFL